MSESMNVDKTKAFRRLQCLAAHLFVDMDDIVECDESGEIFSYRDGIYRVIDLPQEEVKEYEFAVIAIA